MSFASLDQAIKVVVEDAAVTLDEPVAPVEALADDERFLLRELRTLFTQEGLVGHQQNTVVVAAGFAYGFYEKHSAYACQPGRAFRPDITHLGFYRKRNIEPRIPKILHIRDDVPFSPDESERLRATNKEFDAEVTRIIDGMGSLQKDGQVLKVFVLSTPDSPETVRLETPVRHEWPSVWTMGQRYSVLEKVKIAKSTEDIR
jgi:hypothetical protein